MGELVLVHSSTHKSAHPALQGDRPVPKSAKTEECNKIVRQSGRGYMDSLIEPLSSGTISVLCLLIVLSGYAFWYRHGIHDPLDAGPSQPTVRLDRAIVVGKNQMQADTFQGIPYARPP